MLRLKSSEINLDVEPTLEYFTERNNMNYKIVDKTLLSYSNCFLLYEGTIKSVLDNSNNKTKKVFIVEINYIDKSTLNNLNNKKQFEYSIKISDEFSEEKCLKRIGFEYNEEENSFLIIYDKENKEYFDFKSRAHSRMLKLYYFMALGKQIRNFHNVFNISMGLIHPELLFIDTATKQLFTVDNIFYGIVQLVNKEMNFDILSYYGYLQINKIGAIADSYPSQNKGVMKQQIHFKCDVIILTLILMYLFGTKTYDTELYEFNQTVNSGTKLKIEIDDEDSITSIINDTLGTKNLFETEKVKDINFIMTKIEIMLSRELKEEKLNIHSNYVCLNCGLKMTKNHMCETSQIKTTQKDEKLSLLYDKIENIPKIQVIPLKRYQKIEDIDEGIFSKIKRANDEIILFIKKEEKKFNNLILYVNELLLKTKNSKIEALNVECEKTRQKLKNILDLFEQLSQEKSDISVISKYEKELADLLIGVNKVYEDFKNFVSSYQRTLSHFNFDEKISDLLKEVQKEYLTFISSISTQYKTFIEDSNKYVKLLNDYISQFPKKEVIEKEETPQKLKIEHIKKDAGIIHRLNTAVNFNRNNFTELSESEDIELKSN